MIKSLRAKRILDSRGKPTVEAILKTDKGVFKSSCPSGASTGKNEAFVVETKKALENISKIIGPAVRGLDEKKQEELDELLIELDGTENKRKLGANAILPVSIAVLRAGSGSENLPLFSYISKIYRGRVLVSMPRPCFNIINGGAHAKNSIDIQEFMVIPSYESFSKNLKAARKIFKKLGKKLDKKFKAVSLGDEGGFSCNLSSAEEALDFVIQSAGDLNFEIGLDVAASQFSKDQKNRYNVEYFKELVSKYPIIFLEDPFGEEDKESFRKITEELGSRVRIIGDDFLTTNIERIKSSKKDCNGAIIKPNQIGTVTETLRALRMAKSFVWKTIVSHRSGETMDDFIADLAAGTGSDFIKSGAPSKKERMVKYKRLLRIEKYCKSHRL